MNLYGDKQTDGIKIANEIDDTIGLRIQMENICMIEF